MKRIGFICEGLTEWNIVSSKNFIEFLKSCNLEFVVAFDAGGCDNLLPHNIEKFCNNMNEQQVDVIIILADLENDSCITLAKERIGKCSNSISIIAKRQIESWFLSDSITLSLLLKGNFHESNPEIIDDPFKRISEITFDKTCRGIGSSKIKFALKMINNGFSISNAANHPNCSSAKYFIEKLKSVSKQN